MLRIGIVTNHLTSPGVKPGGVSVFAERLAAGLVARGYEVQVRCQTPAPFDFPCDVRSLHWPRFTASRVGGRLVFEYLANVLNAIVYYRDHEVLHAHGDSIFLPFTGLPVRA